MVAALTSSSIEFKDMVPWIISLLLLLFNIYSLKKKDTEKDSRVATKLETIEKAIDQNNAIVIGIQRDIRAIDKRVTILEVKLGMVDIGAVGDCDDE